MALFTREDAKDTARFAKKSKEYTVIVIVDTNNKEVVTKHVPVNSNSLPPQVMEAISKVEDNVLMFNGSDIKQQFPYATTIKDLEVIFYQLVNQRIKKLVDDHTKRERVKEDLAQPKEVYFSQIGYNSQRFRFYIKVRETDKTIWLQRIGKTMVGGDPQNPVVIADPSVIDGDVIQRRKGKNSIKIDDYEFAHPYDGSELHEFSD